MRTEVVQCVCSVPTSWAWLCTTGCLFYVISPCTSLLLPPEPGHFGGDFVILSPLVSWVGPSFCVLCVSDSGENAVGHGAAASAVKALQYWNHYYRRRWHSISLSGKTSIVVFFMRQECGKIKIKFVFFPRIRKKYCTSSYHNINQQKNPVHLNNSVFFLKFYGLLPLICVVKTTKYCPDFVPFKLFLHRNTFIKLKLWIVK